MPPLNDFPSSSTPCVLRLLDRCLLSSPLRPSRVSSRLVSSVLFSFRVTRSVTTIGFPTSRRPRWLRNRRLPRRRCYFKDSSRIHARGRREGRRSSGTTTTPPRRLLPVDSRVYLKDVRSFFEKKNTARLDLETGSWLKLAFPISVADARVSDRLMYNVMADTRNLNRNEDQA